MGVIVMQTAGELNAVTERIIGAAMKVHRANGPGLLESAYEVCLVYELRERGLRVEQQKAHPVVYRGVQLDCGYRLDIVVNECVIVEVKAVEKFTTVYEAQLLSYLRLLNYRVGLLLNFHCTLLKNGVRRIVNDYSYSAISAVK